MSKRQQALLITNHIPLSLTETYLMICANFVIWQQQVDMYVAG